DLPDHAYWERWFPADWVSEMREQIRLWFYAQLFMSVALTGRAPYRQVLGYEKMLDEHGVEMHGSLGNMIDAPEAFAQMGADVMRWMYCAQPPSQNLLFGFGPAYEIQRKLLTLWNSVSFFVQYANIAEFTPAFADLDDDAAGGAVLDRWLVARTRHLVADATAAYDEFLTVNVIRAYEEFVNDLSKWYVRRSRRRFWDGDVDALRTLWTSIVHSLRVIAPVMPFLAERLWQDLVRDIDADAPASVFLAGWPELGPADDELLLAMTAVRDVIDLGREARAAVKLRNRQPLHRIVVEGADRAQAYAQEIKDELNIKDVEFGTIDATELRVRPDLKVLGPRLGKEVGKVRAALEAGNFDVLPDGGFRAAGHDLTAADVLVERTSKEGWAVAAKDGVSIAIDTSLDDALVLEGRVNDLIHSINSARKEAGLELTDRIHLRLARSDEALLAHKDRIAAEVLAVSVELGDADEFQFTRV
ncbi:MAG TPA: DUF5915 domain-containing protein, partial [Acidimicrobiia bacterium]|nr:DUF5915 domain-containing protein [Acidimicrobiia bacterium]